MGVGIKVLNSLEPNLKKIVQKSPDAVAAAWEKPTKMLADDIVHLPPKMHINTGYARDTISRHIADKIVEAPEQGSAQSVKTGKLGAAVVVNAPYAPIIHELQPWELGPRSMAEGGVGPQFVRMKLVKRGKDYLEAFAKGFFKALKKETRR